MADRHGTLNDTTGRVTPASVEHYRRASRGVGLVVAEAFAVAPEGRLHPHMLGLWEDEQIEGAAALAAAIHQSGAVALVQLCYAGLCSKDPASAQVGPSEEYYDITRLARPLTVEEIHTIQRRHVEAALRARRPLLLDLLPLTLEEVFTYEMEALGYSFEELWEGIK